MPNSTPSNFPNKYSPGEKPHPRSISTVANTLKGISNSNSADGIQRNSSSGGNFNALDQRSLKPPIWAMITGVGFIWVPKDLSGLNAGRVPKGSLCYGIYGDVKDEYGNILDSMFAETDYLALACSWVELTEDLKFGRVSDINKRLGNDVFAIPNAFVPKPGDGVALPACYRVAPIYQPNTNFGTIRKNPAFDVNIMRAGTGSEVGPGKIVKLYYGNGNYMLFSTRTQTTMFEQGISYTSPMFQIGLEHDDEQPWLESEDHP